MSYSKDYRKWAIEYREEGHTLEETHQVFKVAVSTIRSWKGTRPLAKLGKTVKIADASNQGKAKGETVSAVSIGFREDTKPFDKADGVFNKDTFFRNLAVIFALLLGQRMILGTLFRQKRIGVCQDKTLVSSIRLQRDPIEICVNAKL